ncbi:P-loop ATPase, Sll1717 family [Neisseria yangbaofengii]|uniref:P-loop ATPase, Sll1717 family n=1 Tax=Neisseria yangbaofengii TaxID=2709396 RepID=UPI0013ECB68B|nr:hypothetical protein [Neisseria yangbaofengii]
MEFNEIEIQRLFGHEAAEQEDQERLKAYYFKSKIYEQVVADLPLRILVGHKGIGKSALFKVAMDEEKSLHKRLTILIKPDDIIDIGEDTDNFLKLIRDWKSGINEIIAQKALSSFGLQFEGWRAKLNQYGGGLLSFLTNSLEGEFSSKIKLEESKRLILANFLKSNKISIYIDDLDRGWQGRPKDIQRISALLNAIRDISSDNQGIYFKVSLRSDVYYLSRTSDESTDKTESSVIWYSWTNHEILVLLVKRIESYFGKSIDEKELMKKHQSELMEYLSPIIETKFTGKGHWQNAPMYRVLMSLIRKRPRDLVKLMTLAARQAQMCESQLITTKNLEDIFEEYSQGRLQDTINEYRSELPDIERLVLGMKPSKKQKQTAENYIYSTDKLIRKIKDIEEQGMFRWANGKKAETTDLAGFLYKINFITARKKTDSGIERKYFEENRYLSNKFADFGYDWEVHPAYRWALQPDNLPNIFESLELSHS